MSRKRAAFVTLARRDTFRQRLFGPGVDIIKLKSFIVRGLWFEPHEGCCLVNTAKRESNGFVRIFRCEMTTKGIAGPSHR